MKGREKSAAGSNEEATNGCKSALSTEIDKWYRFRKVNVRVWQIRFRQSGRKKVSGKMCSIDKSGGASASFSNCLTTPICYLNKIDKLLFRRSWKRTRLKSRALKWSINSKLIMKTTHRSSTIFSSLIPQFEHISMGYWCLQVLSYLLTECHFPKSFEYRAVQRIDR